MFQVNSPMSEEAPQHRKKKRKRVTKIFVCSGGEKLGPFSRQEVTRQLVDGVFKLSDLAWFNRLSRWVTLDELPARPSCEKGPLYPMPAVPQGILQEQGTVRDAHEAARRRRSRKSWFQRLLGR
mgnify:CR=1 FL=1